jgi:cytochrome c oxidase assembly factor CtaG
MARRHRIALAAGAALAAVGLLPPTIAFADQRLSLHMLDEMLLLTLVIPLLAYGAAPLLLGRLRWLHPVSRILALNAVLFGYQLPALLNLVTKDPIAAEAAQAVFMAGAFLFWWPIVRAEGLTPIAKIGYLMVAGVPPTIPGITLAFSHHLFYAAYRSIEDQQIAGLLLFGTAKLALVAGAFVILWRMLAPDGEPPDDDDWRHSEDPLPPNAPAWLRRLDGELPAEAERPRVPVSAGR